MTKLEFLADLYNGLNGLPDAEIEERLNYYSEMIDDLIEDGMTEEEAVSHIGNPAQITAQILADTPVTQQLKKARRLTTGEILLLVLGSPLWFPLLVAAIVVIFSLYAGLWSVIISLWAAFAAIAGTGIGCTIGGIIMLFGENALSGLFVMSGGFVALGLSVFAFLGCLSITKGMVKLTKNIFLYVRNRVKAKVK